MKFKNKLYFITNDKLSKNGVLEDTISVIEGGCKTIQYREKTKSDRIKINEAKKIKHLCKEKNALFLIDNRVDIAQATDADGVHLGQSDMPLKLARKILGEEKIIGITTHNEREAKLAESKGADYVSIGTIFHTDTKKDTGKAVGPEMITKIKNTVNIPVVAIGGINLENIKEVLGTKPDAVAMISTILESDNIKKRVEKIVGLLNEN